MKERFELDNMIVENEIDGDNMIDTPHHKRLIVEGAFTASIIGALKGEISEALKESLKDEVNSLFDELDTNMIYESFKHVVGVKYSLTEANLYEPTEDLAEHINAPVYAKLKEELKAINNGSEDSMLYKIFTEMKVASLSEQDELLREDSDVILEKAMTLYLVPKLVGSYRILSENQTKKFLGKIYTLVENI